MKQFRTTEFNWPQRRIRAVFLIVFFSLGTVPLPSWAGQSDKEALFAAVDAVRDRFLGRQVGENIDEAALEYERYTVACPILSDMTFDGDLMEVVYANLNDQKGSISLKLHAGSHVFFLASAGGKLFGPSWDTSIPIESKTGQSIIDHYKRNSAPGYALSGSLIHVWGKPVPIDGGCEFETSWTHDGALIEPEFLIKVEKVEFPGEE